MVRVILKIDGMTCGMCEAHVNDAIRRSLPVKKVRAAHAKGQTTILADAPLDEAKLREAVSETGYAVLSVEQAPYEKRGLFSCRR